jgi:hypothetical protein
VKVLLVIIVGDDGLLLLLHQILPSLRKRRVVWPWKIIGRTYGNQKLRTTVIIMLRRRRRRRRRLAWE